MSDFEMNCRNEIAAYEARISEKRQQQHELANEIAELQKGIEMRRLFLNQRETLIVPGYGVASS